MIETFISLQKEFDFIIYEIFLLTSWGIWLWTLFFNGAEKWCEEIVNHAKIHNWPISRKFTNPVILKIVITIFLLAVIGGGYGIVINKIK
jgi:hypothetical protein